MESASGITVLVNNADITTGANLLTYPAQDIRTDLETHLFGTLGVIRVFAPVTVGNGEGAIVNVLSLPRPGRGLTRWPRPRGGT